MFTIGPQDRWGRGFCLKILSPSKFVHSVIGALLMEKKDIYIKKIVTSRRVCGTFGNFFFFFFLFSS